MVNCGKSPQPLLHDKILLQGILPKSISGFKDVLIPANDLQPRKTMTIKMIQKFHPTYQTNRYKGRNTPPFVSVKIRFRYRGGNEDPTETTIPGQGVSGRLRREECNLMRRHAPHQYQNRNGHNPSSTEWPSSSRRRYIRNILSPTCKRCRP